jgi:hypothetical protein
MGCGVDFALMTVNGAICLPLTAIIQYILENIRWDLDAHINVLLRLPFLHVPFNVTDDLFQLAWQ